MTLCLTSEPLRTAPTYSTNNTKNGVCSSTVFATLLVATFLSLMPGPTLLLLCELDLGPRTRCHSNVTDASIRQMSAGCHAKPMLPVRRPISHKSYSSNSKIRLCSTPGLRQHIILRRCQAYPKLSDSRERCPTYSGHYSETEHYSRVPSQVASCP